MRKTHPKSLPSDTHPRPLPKGGEESLPPTPSEGGGDRACEELVCTLFVLPSFGGAGGGYWGGRTTYLYLVKIKIHLMINSLVCVPSPFITVKKIGLAD